MIFRWNPKPMSIASGGQPAPEPRAWPFPFAVLLNVITCAVLNDCCAKACLLSWITPFTAKRPEMPQVQLPDPPPGDNKPDQGVHDPKPAELPLPTPVQDRANGHHDAQDGLPRRLRAIHKKSCLQAGKMSTCTCFSRRKSPQG